MTKNKELVSDEELRNLTNIYRQLTEQRRNVFVFSGNLLLTSQQAESNATSATGIGRII